MLAIAIGIAMSVLDGAVANIALPAIAAEFHASPAESIWVVNAYQLAVVMGLLPLASPIHDLLHQRFLQQFIEQDVVGHLEQEAGPETRLGEMKVAITICPASTKSRATSAAVFPNPANSP